MEIVIKESCSGFFSCLSPSDWISIIATFSAAIAAVASLLTIYHQRKKDREDKIPIIIPGAQEIDTNVTHILDDWTEDGEQLPKKFSKTTIPLWNYGKTPVFNISYSYRSPKDFKVSIEKKHTLSGLVYSLQNDNNKMKIEYEYDGRQELKSISIHNFKRTADSLLPSANVKLFLPDYFIIVLNDYFLKRPFIDEGESPYVILKVIYDNTFFKTWIQEYKIFIDHYSYSGNLTTNFQYEILNKSPIRRVSEEEYKKIENGNVIKRRIDSIKKRIKNKSSTSKLEDTK